MKMQSRAVGKRGSRRFASAAAGAACRTKTFLVFSISVRAEDGDTAARLSTATSDRGCAVFSCDGWSELAGPSTLGCRHNKEPGSSG